MSTRGTVAKLQERRWRQWSPEKAQELLAEWRASGLSLGRFARERGLGGERLRWYFDSLAGWVAGEANDAHRHRHMRKARLLDGIAEQLEAMLSAHHR
ncbi:hypothetical protein [Hyalangium gracile]|uniref:hypothetical protein n=1 Tax=Hyalangium gracile TaxID=394092 RepID=UPI001CCDBCB7|nr:hypothetical protein [Hyalangium gracile]